MALLAYYLPTNMPVKQLGKPVTFSLTCLDSNCLIWFITKPLNIQCWITFVNGLLKWQEHSINKTNELVISNPSFLFKQHKVFTLMLRTFFYFILCYRVRLLQQEECIRIVLYLKSISPSKSLGPLTCPMSYEVAERKLEWQQWVLSPQQCNCLAVLLLSPIFLGPVLRWANITTGMHSHPANKCSCIQLGHN